MCIDTTCTKSGKRCVSISDMPDTLPQNIREEIKAFNPDQKFGEEEFQALKANITLGCSPGSNSSDVCVCVGKINFGSFLSQWALLKSV